MKSPIQTSERFIDVPGGQVFIKHWMPDGVLKSPLILLHDSLGCVEMWRDFPAFLAERVGREVIAYDRLGFGKSSLRTQLPSTRFINEEAEVYLPEILKTLKIEKFSLFGHSVGGAMAVSIAALFQDRCEYVITESAQAFVEEQTREGIRQAQESFKKPEVFEKLQRYHGPKTQWVLDAWIRIWLSDEFSDWSLKKELPIVTCPILAIHGDRDEYGTRAFPDMICNLAGGPSKKLIISQCGHFPHREKPELILDTVTDFGRLR